MRAARPVPARPVPPPAAGGALSQSGPAAVTGPPPPPFSLRLSSPGTPGKALPSLPHTHTSPGSAAVQNRGRWAGARQNSVLSSTAHSGLRSPRGALLWQVGGNAQNPKLKKKKKKEFGKVSCPLR